MYMGTHTHAYTHAYFISISTPALFKIILLTFYLTFFFSNALLLLLVCFLTFHLRLFYSHLMKGEF